MSKPTENSEICSVCGGSLPAGTLRGLCPKCLLLAGLEGMIGGHLHIRCPQCRIAIEVVAEESLKEITCPSCDSRFSLLGNPTENYLPEESGVLGRFKLLERVGMGAFGSVWKANDSELDRIVAIKIPRKEQLNIEETEQFLREARSAAQLKHPGIVSVHEIGRDQDSIYIVSDFIQGVTLADWLTAQQPTPNEAAGLCGQIANALQHAHDHGVIHRDLKPSNIIMDDQYMPHVTDFGLAKREASEITVTIEGRVLGTPAYMSPEQASGYGHQADARTDIYSLGVILFELLTGEKPFRGNSRMLMHQVIHEDAPSPRKLNGNLPRDLETICLTCLEKDPDQRYQSAGELADELARFQNGEPICARPVSVLQRCWRWSRRNPMVAGLSAAVALSLLIGLAMTSWQWRQTEHARSKEQRQRQRAEDFADESRQRLVRYYVAEGNRYVSDRDPFGALPWFVAAMTLDEERRDMHQLRIDSVLDQNPRLESLFFHESEVTYAAFTPNGKSVAIAGENGTVRTWDLNTEQPIGAPLVHGRPVQRLLFRHDGKQLLTISGRYWGSNLKEQIHLWDVATGEQTIPVIELKGEVLVADLSLDGRRIVTIDNEEIHRDYYRWTANLWNGQTGKLVRELGRFENSFGDCHAAIGDDGRRIVVALGKHLHIFDAEQGAPLHKQISLKRDVEQIGFNADGSLFFTAQTHYPNESRHPESELRVWNTETGQMIAELHPRYQAKRVTFTNNDAQLLVVGTSGEFWIGAIANGRRQDESNHDGFLPSHRDFWVSSDNLHLATLGGNENEKNSTRSVACQIWNLMTGKQLPFLLHHAGGVKHVAFSPTGERLLTCGEDHSVRLWNIAVEQATVPPREYLFPRDYISWTKISEDGRRALVFYNDVGIQLWDLQTRQPISPLHGLAEVAEDFGDLEHHTSPDCLTVYYATRTKQLKRLHVETGEETTILDQVDDVSGWPPLVYFSRNGQSVLVRWKNEENFRWLIRNNQGDHIEPVVVHDDTWRTAVEFSSDGRLVVLGSIPSGIRIFNTSTGKPWWTPQNNVSPKNWDDETFLLFNRKGDRLLWGFNEVVKTDDDHYQRRGILQLLDVKSKRPVHPARRLSGYLKRVQFSHDGRFILTSLDSRPGNLTPLPNPDWSETQIWSAITGEPVMDPIRHPDHAIAVFSYNGKLIATGCRNGFARIWDAQTGKPVTPPMPHPGSIHDLLFSHNDQMLATTSGQGTKEVGRVWDVRTGEPLSSQMDWGDYFASIQFSKDDGELLTVTSMSGNGECVRFWPLRSHSNIQRMDCTSQILALRRVDADGADIPIERSSLPKLWNPLQQTGIDVAKDVTNRELAWHRSQSNKCIAAKNWDSALFHLNWLIDRQPTHWKLHLNRGLVRATRYQPNRNSDDWEQIISDYTTAFEWAPNEPIVWSLRAEAYTRIENWKAAADDFERLSQRTHDSQAPWKHALARLAAGQTEKYRQQCQQILNRYSHGDFEHEFLWVCLLRNDAVQDHDLVLQFAEKKYSKNRGKLIYHDIVRNYAAALFRVGRNDESLALIKNLMEHWKENPRPEIWPLLALIHQRMGNNDESQSWQKKTENHINKPNSRIRWADRVVLETLLKEWNSD